MTRKKNKTLSRDELQDAVLGVLPDLLIEWLQDGEFRDGKFIALNPNRVDHNLGSFQIDLETGAWRDYAIDQGGPNAISLHAYLYNSGDYAASAAELAGCEYVLTCSPHCAPQANVAKRLKRKSGNSLLAKRLYNAGGDLKNQPAEKYLESRGLLRQAAWDRLKASSAIFPGKGACPVLLAPIDAPDGDQVALHRTFLQPGGEKLGVPNPRRTLGQVKGNAIQLGEAKEELIVCEGLEDGLTLHQELGLPVWVACGAGFLHSMIIPDAVRSVIIAADNDLAGERAAYAAAEAMAVLSRRVRIIRPAKAFKDFNDELCGVRHDG